LRVGAKTRTLESLKFLGFEGSSLCPCFSPLKSDKKCQFSTLKIL
jgi:hypothetical protein